MTDNPEDEAALDADARAYHADDLVKRLRAEDPECGLRHSLAMEAADYIENMESMIEWMENMDPKLVKEARMVLWETKDAD